MATEEEQAQNEIDLSGDTIVETGEDPRIPEFSETRLPEEREEVNRGDLSLILDAEGDAFKRAYAIEHPEITDEELERVASEHRADMAAIPSFSTPGRFTRTFVPGETLASLSHGESYKKWIGEAYDVGHQVVDDISSGAIGLVDGFVAIGEMALSTEKTKRDVEEMVQTGDLLSLEGDVKGYNEWLTGGSALIAGTATLVSGLSGIAGKPLLAQLGQATMAGLRGLGAYAMVPYVVVPMASELFHPGATEGNLVYRWYQWGPAQIQNYLERNISNVDALKQYVVEDAARLGVEDPEQYFEDEYNRARNTRLQFDYWVASRDMNLPEEEQDRRKQGLLAMAPGLIFPVMYLESTDVFPELGPDTSLDDVLKFFKENVLSDPARVSMNRMVGDPVVEGLTASFLRIQEAALSRLGGDAPVFAERDKFIKSIGGVLGGRPEWDEIIQHVQAVQEEPERARDLLPKIERLIMIQSYNSLPDEVKKDQPPAGRFVEIANTIQPERLNDPSFTQGSPSLIRAVKAVHDGKSEEEVQDLINEISFGALDSIFVGHPETFRAVIPTDKELLGWAEKQAENRALVGGLEARKMTQAMGAVSLDVGEVYAQENALGTLFRFANAAMVGWGEADLGKTDDPLGSGAAGAAAFGLHGWRKGGKVGGIRGAAIGGAAGLIYSQVGTPAAMDFHHGYGFRDPDHSWFARWLGRMNSGSGDLPVMYREIFLEGGGDPSDLLFKGKMLGIHAADLFVPAEAPATKLISGGYGAASARYSTLKALQNSPDTPVGHLATAVISPWVYAHWQGLTDSDPFTVINHLALVGAKSSRLQGKSAFSMLNKIQQEQVLEAVRMVGVDPTKLTGMEVEEAIRTGRIYRTNVKRLLRYGSPERLALRKSEEYERVKAELQRVVDAGNIKQYDADAAILFHEDNAFTAVLDPRSRVDSVTGYFNALRYEVGGKEAPGAIVFRQEDPEAALKEAKTAVRELKGTKVVDEAGEPLVVYHGTPRDFDEFDFTRTEGRVPSDPRQQTYGAGAYFTPYRLEADSFAGETGRVVEAHLSIKNPFIYGLSKPGDAATKVVKEYFERAASDHPVARALYMNEKMGQWNRGGLLEGVLPPEELTKALKADGFDGVNAGGEWVVFDPSQIHIIQPAKTADREVSRWGDMTPAEVAPTGRVAPEGAVVEATLTDAPDIPNDPVAQKVLDLMDGIEAINRSDEIVEHEMGWHHSARAVGPKIATEQAMAVDGFEAYSDAVSNAVRQQFGDAVNVYGLMTSAEYRAWVSGDDAGSVQVSLRPKEASVQIDPRYSGRAVDDLVLVHFEAAPENIIMRDGGERTFVLDLKEVDQSRSLVLDGEAHPPVSNAPIQVADIRAIMNDIGMNPDDPVVLDAVASAMSEKRGQPGKRVLEAMTDAELNVLAGKLLDGKVVPAGKAKKVVSKKSAILKNKRKKGSLLNKFWKREIEAQDGVPKTLLVRTRFKPTKGLPSIPLAHKERAVANVAKHADSPSFDGAGENEKNWGRHMANLSGKTKDNLVLAGPKKLFEWVENPQAYVDFISDGVEADGGAAMRHAREGLELTDAFIEQFRAGQVDANTTGLLAFWGFLSRGVSPYPQEAGFIDGVFAGVEPFIDLAVRGEFDDVVLARYLDWAKGVSPKGGDTPGSGVLHNINAFGKNFLKNMGKKTESGDHAGKSKLALFHEWLGDAEKSGTQIRRDYMAMAEGAGLGTKVISFILMLSGRKDVIVLDRWMIRFLWDADNPAHGYAVPEIYEGYSGPSSDSPDKKVRRVWFHPAVGIKGGGGYIGKGKKRRKATESEILDRDDLVVDFMLDKDRKWSKSRGLSNIVTGTRWLAVQEAIEHKLQQILPQTLGRITALRPGEVNLATFHWLTWNTVASQGAAHASLQALLRRTMGHKDPFLGAYSKEGRYRTYDFGLQYINLGGGRRRYLFTDRVGEMHILEPDSLKTALDEIRRHASVKNVENRVVPHGFKVTDDRFPNIPWRERPSVNADNLEAIFRAHAEPTADSEAIGAAAAIARGYVGAANFGRGGVEPDDSGTFNHMGPRGVLGQFEWNSKAGRGVIRFFENANETTLFHENAHALVILMGRAWRDRLVKQFDSTTNRTVAVDRFGRRTGRLELTRKGHEQAAESLAMYWLTRTASPAGINKMFDQLYLRLRELWATIRNEPLTEKMNPQMRLFWDQTLRVQEAVRPRAEVLTHSAIKKGRPKIRVAGTPEERIIEGAVAAHGKRREAARIDLNPEHIRQALGLTYETYRKADGSVGRRIAQREVDAIELLDRAVAYVITESARKQYKGLLTTPLVRLTARSMVPEERVEGIQKRVKNRIKQAVGVRSSELGKNIASTKPGSRNEVVNRPNIDPFYDPSYRYEDLPTDYIMLTGRQAAGFKTMVHEVAAEPIAKGNISDRLLQSDSDFRLVPIDDYNAVLESVIDLEAGVGARTTDYALRVPPTLGYAFVNALGGLSAKLVPDNPLTRKLEYWKAEYFTAPEVIGDELMEPAIKGIIEQTIRELNDIPNWVRRVVRDTRREDGKERTLEVVYRDLVEMLIPPIKLDHARRLVDMHNDLKGALRIATPGAEGKEFIPLTRKALNGKLNDIQGMLQDGPGMSDRERASLTLIRTYERVPSENLTPQDLFAIGDAVSTITDGLRIREESISLRGKEIAMALEGSIDKAVIKNLLISDYLDLYEGFFTGDFLKLFDIYSNKGRDVVKNFDQTTAVLEMITRMRANNIIARLSRRMVEAEYLSDVESVLKDRPGYPRFGYDTTGLLDRIDFYLHQIINWDQYVVFNEKAGPLKVPGEPPEAAYSMHELAARRQDPEVRSKRDIVAYNAASDILNKWGFKVGKGTWTKYVLPDGTETLLPSLVIKEIEDAAERAAHIGAAWTRTPKGAKDSWRARVYKRTVLSDRVNIELDNMKVTGWDAKGKVGDALETIFGMNPLSANAIRLGVTVGFGLVHPAYYAGVLLGTALAVQQTQGSAGFLKAMGRIPGEAGRALVGQPGIVGAVMGRMWKEGAYSPEGPALVTQDGRIYTTGALSQMAMREGLKGSFIMAETARSMAKQFQDAVKAEGNPSFLKTVKGVPKWWLQTCIEVVTAFDNYFRVGIFVDELSAGKSPSVAADRAKTAAFDYSALSDFERTTMRFVVMFYSYMRKNMDLFYDTLLRNPGVILGQLRLLNGFQSSQLEGEPQIVLPTYMQSRLMPAALETMYTAHRHQVIGMVLPPINLMDMLSFMSELYNLGSKSDAVSQEALRMLVSRTTPWVQAPFVLATEKDIFFGRDLDRKPNQVPPWLVEWDLNVTGGVLYDFLGIKPVWATRPQYDDVPGRMIYVARNPKAWWLWRNMVQIPMAGRSVDTITALDRSNIGAVEFMTMLTHEYAELTEPLYKQMGWLAGPEKRHPVDWDLPEGDWRRDTMLPRADMMTIDEEGHARPTDFSWIEFAGFLGLRAKYIEREDQAIFRLYETKRLELEASIKKKEPTDLDRE